MEYKRVSIITNHIEKFKKIEKQISNDYGIMITIGNNKKKSLSKAQIILNIDFPTELINQYNIYENATIVNIKNEVRIKKKRFNGKIINNYEIKYNDIEDFDYDKQNKYRTCEIYESQIYKKQAFENIVNKIKKDKVEIIELKQ